MSVLIVDKAERLALEAEFAKLKEAGLLPGGVMLGVPVEAEDGRFLYCDTRWDIRDEKDQPAVSKCVATLVADPKVAVSKARVEAEVPKDFVHKTESVAKA